MGLSMSGVELSLGVILLAAGASSRMGKPKLLLPWGDTTVLGHLWRTWRELGARQVAVVVAGSDDGLNDALDQLGFPREQRIVNPRPEEGMFSSIQCAARWTGWEPGLTHWLISLGDQPHVKTATLAALLEFAGRHPQNICQPGRQGRAKHPVVLPRTVFGALAATREPTLKTFLAGRGEGRVPCESDDAGLDLDLDYPEDYTRAVRLFSPYGNQ